MSVTAVLEGGERGWGRRWILGVSWPTRLAKMESCRINERLRGYGGEQ